MKIVGYCALWSIAFALLVAICVILRQGHIPAPGANDSEIAAGKVVDHTRATATSPAPKPAARASLPSV
jgi:hypothetical protein